MMSSTKVCRICGLELPLEDFTIRHKRTSRRSECKICNNIRNKQYRIKNSEKIKTQRDSKKDFRKLCYKKYRLENKEKIKETKRIWRQKNKEKIRKGNK